MNKVSVKKYTALIKKTVQYRIPDSHNISIDCPFCGLNTNKYHMAVSTTIPVYKCWKCGLTGHLLKLLERLGLSYESDGTEYLYEQSNTSLYDELRNDVHIKLELPYDYVPLDKPSASLSCKRAMDYLLGRGISKEKIQKYHLGFCPVGHYADRIIVPSYDSYNNLVFYVARSIFNIDKKVLNPSTQVYGIGSGDIVFNIQNNLDKGVVIVNEGIFDSMTIDSVSLFGKKMSDNQFNIIKSLPAEEIIIMLDSDATSFSYEIAERLYPYKKVSVIELPKGEDPNSLGESFILEAIKNRNLFKPTDGMLFKLKRRR